MGYSRLRKRRRPIESKRFNAGDLFKQPQLAETLRKVATQGSDYIYQGDWAKKFVAAVQSEGGKMTLADGLKLSSKPSRESQLA
jgi:gamma-glutamyltranspeptidase